jgi:hypothetical protein
MSEKMARTKVLLEVEIDNWTGPLAALNMLQDHLVGPHIPVVQKLNFIRAESNYVLHQAPTETFQEFKIPPGYGK